MSSINGNNNNNNNNNKKKKEESEENILDFLGVQNEPQKVNNVVNNGATVFDHGMI